MLFSRASGIGIAALVGMAAAPPLHASVYSYSYTQGMPGMPAAQNTGGYINSVNTQFNSTTKQLSFSVAFGPATGQSWLSTQGFWLVMDNGPTPVSMANELSIFYFDASNMATPRLAVYSYDGSGTPLSYTHSDLIKGAFETSFINSISVVNGSNASGPQRTMSFNIDATSIINYTPSSSGSGPWIGTGFGSTKMALNIG